MASSVSALVDRARSPGGQKAIRYTIVSAIAFATFEVSLFVLVGLLHWGARNATILANVIGGVPSYYLNRRWAWGKTGKSHLWKEVTPFWALAFLSLAFSTWAADAAEGHAADITSSHLGRTLVIMGATVAAYGLLWVGKFVVMNKLIFVHREPPAPALDGRTGVPT